MGATLAGAGGAAFDASSIATCVGTGSAAPFGAATVGWFGIVGVFSATTGLTIACGAVSGSIDLLCDVGAGKRLRLSEPSSQFTSFSLGVAVAEADVGDFFPCMPAITRAYSSARRVTASTPSEMVA